MMLITPLLYAQSASGAGASQAQNPSMLSSMMPFLLIIFIFYFLMFRPQQKRMKEHRKLLEQLKKGDRVVTSAGMHGTVSQIKQGELVEIEVHPGVRITFSKSSVTHVLKDNQDIPKSETPQIT